MNIIDEALAKLDSQSAPPEARAFTPKHIAPDPMADMRLVAGASKRRPLSLLMAVALAMAGVLVYFLLPREIPQPARKAPAENSDAAIPPFSSERKGAAAQAVPAPAWYEAGWREARAGKWTEALAHWEYGVRGLPRDRLLIVSNSYANPDRFSSALNQHARMFPAMGVRQQTGGQTLYCVVIFPYGGGARHLLPKVQHAFPGARLVNASRVQQDMSGSVPPIAAMSPQKSVMQETPSVGHKLSPDSRPPADQKSNGDPKQPGNQVAPAEKLAAATKPAAEPDAKDWQARSAAVRDQLKAENYPEAIKNAQSLSRDFPERWEPWFWLGTARLAQGQMDAAEAALERASKLNPKVAQVWVQRAVVAQEHGDHMAAIKLLNEAHDLSPKSPQIYLNLGYSNDALGLTAEADKNYLRFLSLTEGDSAYAMQRKPIMERLESRH